MLIVLLIFVLLIAICALPGIYALYDEAAARRKPKAESVKEPASPRPPHPESLEGVLVAQLAGGEITQGQYIRAMAKIAARDDERHPLAVPPEQGAAGV